MRHLPVFTALVAMMVSACASSHAAQTDADPAEAPGNTAPPVTPDDDPIGQLIDALNADDNGLTIDREARVIDITAKVCLREGEFLEQLACSPDTREHESILVLQTQPSLVHTALLLMGLEPGSPIRWEEVEDGVRTLPPSGPPIDIFIHYEAEGEEKTVPANEWVADQKTGEPMAGNTWLFAGSKFVEVNGQEMYVADAYGTAISLVNFGDDLLARSNELTDSNDNHDRIWGARTAAIPEVGTEVRLRLVLPATPDNPADAATDPPSTGPESAPQPGPQPEPAAETRED